jgi:Tol biopolymer transport system component
MLLTSGTQHFNIWEIALTGGTPLRITTGPAPTANPAFSPDGGRLLYDAERDGMQQILLRNLAAGDERVVATGPMGATAPRWISATQFAFRRRTAGGHDAYLLDLSTGESRLLAKDAAPCGTSPDGRILLLAANGGIDALQLSDLARTPFLRGTSLTDASFSPDGASVVVTDGVRIFLARAAAPTLTPLAEGTSPRWSADGRRIFLIRDAAVYATDLTGKSTLVWRSPSPRLSLEPVNPAAQTLTLAPGRLALILAETTLNLWLTDSH